MCFSSDRSQRSYAGDDDDIATPYIKLKDTPSRSSWDDDEGATPGKFSSWDASTPGSERRDRVTARSFFPLLSEAMKGMSHPSLIALIALICFSF